jgi:hypothetical protein
MTSLLLSSMEISELDTHINRVVIIHLSILSNVVVTYKTGFYIG